MLKAPFPYFGGKSAVSHLIWERFGDVPNYVEPFAGSLAVLLSRPRAHEARSEIVNDKDCMIANFWRAIVAEPEKVAYWADYPISEVDMYARHAWLIRRINGKFAGRMREDPEYFSAKVAGWWLWGISTYMGSGWCDRLDARTPSLTRVNGVHNITVRSDIRKPLLKLAQRLRYVKVCNGDWSRVVTDGCTSKIGLTGVFLDPPYDATRVGQVYAQDDTAVYREAFDWAVANGDNPMLRIAACGYEGMYQFPDSWGVVKWRANGGYGNQADGTGRANKGRERIWFSPYCKAGSFQPILL